MAAAREGAEETPAAHLKLKGKSHWCRCSHEEHHSTTVEQLGAALRKYKGKGLRAGVLSVQLIG
jgi:hypothetical protein